MGDAIVIPAKNGITSAQLQIILNAAKKDAGSCASAFSAGMIPYRLKFSLKAFDAQIQNAKYLQYPNPATSPLGPLSSVEAQALKGSIALYPNFFTDTSARQAGIVVHENLHTYTGWNDANVFYAFQQRGITLNEIKLFTSYGNTDGITTCVCLADSSAHWRRGFWTSRRRQGPCEPSGWSWWILIMSRGRFFQPDLITEYGYDSFQKRAARWLNLVRRLQVKEG